MRSPRQDRSRTECVTWRRISLDGNASCSTRRTRYVSRRSTWRSKEESLLPSSSRRTTRRKTSGRSPRNPRQYQSNVRIVWPPVPLMPNRDKETVTTTRRTRKLARPSCSMYSTACATTDQFAGHSSEGCSPSLFKRCRSCSTVPHLWNTRAQIHLADPIPRGLLHRPLRTRTLQDSFTRCQPQGDSCTTGAYIADAPRGCCRYRLGLHAGGSA